MSEEVMCSCCGKFHEEGTECPNHEKHPVTFNKQGKPNILWWLFALPCIIVFVSFHWTLCFFLTIFVYPPERRKKCYEYYEELGG